MENKPKAVKVNIKGGKVHRIAVSDISTYREWEEEGITDHTVIFTKGGKQLVCDIPEEKIDEQFEIIDLTK